MPGKTFVWKAELGSAPHSAFSAQLDKVTYHVATHARLVSGTTPAGCDLSRTKCDPLSSPPRPWARQLRSLSALQSLVERAWETGVVSRARTQW